MQQFKRERIWISEPYGTKCETMALLTDGKDDFIDKEYADFTAEMWSKGHSFFCYLSDSPDSLSSCCFSGSQKVLWKSSTSGVHLTTLKELYEAKWEAEKISIYHNGKWEEAKPIKLPNRKMFKVTTENNKEFYMTDNHINVTVDGEKDTASLTTDDYLVFSHAILEAIPEKDENLTFEQGMVIGEFLNTGSFEEDSKNNTICNILFSLNNSGFSDFTAPINLANEQVGESNTCDLAARISSKPLAEFIMKWTNWMYGTNDTNKELNLDCLLQSVEFRRGILEGWHSEEDDINESYIAYTTSKKLAECMEALITSLGMQSTINVETKLNKDKVYEVEWYEDNSDSGDNMPKYLRCFKVKSIEDYQYTDDVYCIERANQDNPYFTLPCGLITHNCRLRNSLKDIDIEDTEHNHTTHQYSMGTASVSTGSKSVMTINLPRIVQNSVREVLAEHNLTIENGAALGFEKYSSMKQEILDRIKKNVGDIVERVHKYQTAFNDIIKDFFKSGMLDVYSAGFIDMRRQYLTVGVNGIVDAAEFCGIEAKPCEEYKEFVVNILETINILDRKDRTRECMFNCEFVPAENLAVKNYKWDKKDGYYVSPKRNLYSSYFYAPEDTTLSVLDKMRLHGKDFTQYLDGGSALHENQDHILSQKQYRQLLRVAADNGCNYFTFNVKSTVCNDCGYISKHTLDKCPKCGSENLDYLTRVIGYLKRISSFSEARQIEAGKRYFEGEPPKMDD